ncbi:dehydrodolichyl diphosphate synthase complex subunit nus1 [Dendroctonus ponderosae]|uniref:ditrans,polycis-polyprenyl diphosphate synthase [(2E,6E)-farnesyldiphosphate specific] n=1 Tax=Dendroctonus ponderosae TaxID=77166 RepID=U4U3S7_DENPD|nr:dehydrodolichyl diphosphate synthase complex subunit nus1 [Dendroctonus ponderosae]ERL85251.1 hypothetical protein D910_02672 [Dendroctonus ponderosae]KAH1029086.1 hypothetical protein HUJ05_002385 [Dendroctonus ponderosae]
MSAMTGAPLYRALNVLVHSLFTIYQWLVAWRKQGGVFVGAGHEFDDVEAIRCLEKEIAVQNKIPKHLTVLLGQEEPSYPDLANIVLWSISHRIRFLSFYDYQGVLWKHRHKLEAAISEKIPHKDSVIWHNRRSLPCQENGNGLQKRLKPLAENGKVHVTIHLRIISPQNGRQSIVRLAQDLCQDAQAGEWTIESLDQKLRAEFEFPDPDLGLSCGNFLSLLHYPPWQIRVTEFLSIKTHHRIKYRQFLEQLSIFASCEQRLGR